MKLKKIMAMVLCVAMVLSTMSFTVFAAETAFVAKVGDIECVDADAMISALNDASGDVTVGIYGKVETSGFGLNNSNITKLSFVAAADDAEICVDGVSYIDIRYTAYPVEFTGLTLSHTNAGQNIDGFLPQYFSTYNGGNVTYTECTFPNGVTACGSTADTTYTFTDCIFNNTTSGLYSLWVYGNSTNVVVNGGTFSGVRGIKLYSEGSDDFSSLSVSGATFSDTITEKHAIVLTKGESITLTGNTFNNTTGTVQVDDDYASAIEGKTVTIDGTEYTVDSESLALEEATSESVLSGSGTVEDPYLINNIDDLVKFRDDVNAGNTYESEYVLLTADIDFEGYQELNNAGVLSNTFKPIANSGNDAYFMGTFDGGNHTISNLYQSGWELGYEWGSYGSLGLFGMINGATIQNLTVEGFELCVEGGDVAAIAGSAEGNCTFKNINVEGCTCATYNNGCGSIIGWAADTDYLFENITVDEDTVIAGLWGSFDSSLGGIVGQFDGKNGVATFRNVDVACRLDCYNDVTAAYKWYSYRMCGMLIGRMTNMQSNNATEVDPREHIVLDDVTITIGEWANYTYINTSGNTWARVEPGYAYGGVNVADYPDATIETQVFNTIIGGPQSQKQGYYGSSVEDLEALEDFDTSTLVVEDLAYVARQAAEINGVYYETLEEAFEKAEESDTIKLLNNAAPSLTSQKAITKASVIDLNGKTLTLTEDDLYFGTTTFKNGTIVVAPSVVTSTAAFWMFEGQTLTFDDVDIVATGVTGTYLIGINGGENSAVNITNGSTITIDNDTIAGLTAVICDNGTGNIVTIDNADIDVANIEGRFYLGGANGTISVNNSDIDLNGVKEGFYLRAGQNLSISGTSVVNVTLNSTEDCYGINVTDATATYNKADTATVNATDNIPNYVAFIGETGYETLAGAISDANSGETIVLADDIAENVTIDKNITIDGADKNYTGTMTANAGITATVQNVNFVNGGIDKAAKSTTGTYTIKNCTFDGQGTFAYPLRIRGANSVTVEDCTVKDYLYSFLYVTSGTNTVSVKDVTVEDCPNYAVYLASGVNSATFENLTVKNSNNGFIINNTANRALTIKDCKMENVGTAIIHANGTKTVTCTVIGANDFGTSASSEYAKYVLGENATLKANEGYTVTTNIDAYFVKYADGTYKAVKAIAQVGNVKYDSLAEAIAVGGDVILLADIENASKIAVNSDVSLDLNGHTISGVCDANQKYIFMVNNGTTMTIKDSSAAQTGKITYSGDNSTGWIVDVEGKLVLESGTLELTGTWNIGYAVDVRPNAWGTAYTEATTFVMNGGKIISSDGAVRVASSSSDTYKDVSASFTMNGGEIEAAWDGVFVQQSNAAWDVLNVTINDGTIKSGLNPIRFYGPAATSYVNGEDCVDIELNGGTLTYTGTETQQWLIDGILRLGGGVTADEFTKDSDVIASASFASANVADGYSWVSIGRRYRLQALGEYSFVLEATPNEIIDSGSFTVTVKVASEKVDNFYSTEYIVTYDSNLLTCAEDNGTPDFDSTTGKLRLQYLDGADVNEVIGTLNFTTKEFYLTQTTEIKVSGIVCATQYDAAVGASESVADVMAEVLLKDRFNVTVGEGLEGDTVAYNKTDYVVKVAADNQGKQNTVKYSIKDADGNPVEYSVILPVGTNEYTIKGDDITGDMTFEISDAYSIEIIKDYVTGYALILVDGSADGYTYNGYQMLKITRDSGSFQYNGRYGWLVDGSAPGTTLESVEAAAYAAIRAGGTSKAVETGYDVNSYINGDGKINFYDVSAAYACQKVDFALSDIDDYYYMELYLASDTNCDGKVDSSDSAAISVNYN